TTSFPSASYQEDVRAIDIFRTLEHHIIADGLQGFRFKEIHHAFCTRFRAGTLRVIGSIANDHASASILDVFQMQGENFSWPQTTMKHQEQHSSVSSKLERVQEPAYLILIHRARHPSHGLDAKSSSDGPLTTHPSHERA